MSQYIPSKFIRAADVSPQVRKKIKIMNEKSEDILRNIRYIRYMVESTDSWQGEDATKYKSIMVDFLNELSKSSIWIQDTSDEIEHYLLKSEHMVEKSKNSMKNFK